MTDHIEENIAAFMHNVFWRFDHGQDLIDGLNKILQEACRSCINHFYCYAQKKDGTLKKNYKGCSKMTFEQKMALIGHLCYYHATLNPQGYIPKRLSQ